MPRPPVFLQPVACSPFSQPLDFATRPGFPAWAGIFWLKRRFAAMKYFSGTVLHNYRQQTDDMAKSPLGGGMRFICPECRSSQPLKGRRSRGFKNGFRCAICVEARNGCRDSPK